MGGAEMAVGGDATGKQFVHQPRFDVLILRNQRLRLLNRLIHRRKNFGDALLMPDWRYWKLKLLKESLRKSGKRRTRLLRINVFSKDARLKDAPDLRIIGAELWDVVAKRLERRKGQSRSAFRDVESKYLLTGMARCAHCGGPMTIVGQNYHREKGRYYGCSYYKSRGSSICKNSLLVEQELLDQTVLKAIEEALTEEMLKVAIEKALANHRAGASVQLDHRSRIERELSLIEAQLRNLVDAVANGRKDGALFERLATEEARKRSLIEELERLTRPGQATHLDEARLKRELKARLADTRALLGRHITSARRLLQALIEHPLRLETTHNGDRKGYRVTGTGSYLPLLSESGRSVVIGVPNGI